MRTGLTAALCAVVASLALATGAQAKAVSGTNGGDSLSGTASADAIKAKGGNDRIQGRGGDDRINAGKGRDRVNAGRGDDTVQARDGSADKVTCGAGDDTVRLDAEDVIADATASNPDGSCESVQQAGEQTDSEADSDRQGPGRDGRDCPAKEEQPASGDSDES